MIEESHLQNNSRQHLVVLQGSTFEYSGPDNFLMNHCRMWKKLGYKVTVICQDRGARDMEEVDDYIQGQLPQNMPKLKEGQLRIIVPNVNNLVPILANHKTCSFEGVICKTLPDMTDQEIQTNISMTCKCLKEVCQHDRPLKVICNFIILSGIIAQRGLQGTGITYDLILPGPALRYTIMPHPELWKWIIPSFKKAVNIYPRTCFVKQLFLKTFKDYVLEYGLKKKLKLLGVSFSTQKFLIPKSYEKVEQQFLQKVKIAIENHDNDAITEKLRNYGTLSQNHVHQSHQSHNDQKIPQTKLIKLNLLERWLPYNEQDETILYLGAIMNKMGVVELTVMASKLIIKRPTLKFIFVGAGPMKQPMLRLVNAFYEGDFQKANEIVKDTDLDQKIQFEKWFIKIEKWVRDRIIFTGLLDQESIQKLMPLCTIFIVPSKLPQECNLSIIEALCYGVTPIAKQKSFFIEFMEVIENAYPQLAAVCRSDQQQFYQKLPETLTKTLDFIKNNKLGRKEYKQKLNQLAFENFSWEHSARMIAQGPSNQNQSQ